MEVVNINNCGNTKYVCDFVTVKPLNCLIQFGLSMSGSLCMQHVP